ncbi:MAG: hypothetical protein KY469_20610 [Actinobacteria bacterium]|nr:hypothetical protein [Actinomycetota bacterium]
MRAGRQPEPGPAGLLARQRRHRRADIKEPDGAGFTDGSPAVPAGTVVAAVGWRGGNHENEDGVVQSPGNGIYRSETGAPGSFVRVDERPPGETDSPLHFTEQHRIGRVELGAATGDDQDHDYLYAIVQDAVAINGGINTMDAPDGSPDEEVPYNTMLEGVYVSPDFGASWTRLNDDQDYQGPETGSALSVTFSALGYQPGIQAWYNLCVQPDPTRTDPVTNAPTRMIVCLEEVWQNEDTSDSGALNEFKVDSAGKGTATPMKVIGPYYKGTTCQALTLGAPLCPTNRDPAASTTTHPDQHGALFLPDGEGGVHLFMGNDGGVYRQSKGPDQEFDSTSWGNGNNLGFQTLLPYHARIARDGTVWFGLQDNGSAKVDPEPNPVVEGEDDPFDGQRFNQYATYGGDGFFMAVDPDNSDVAYSETPLADMRSTGDGGKSWSGMAPPSEGEPYRFNNPFVMDPTDANHLMTAGSKVYETTQGPGTTTSSWVEVYDLGTSASPGDPEAEAGEGEIDNQMTAIDTVRDAAYVGFCGTCDILNSDVPFQNGLATNVDGGEPRERLTSKGWHIASAKGLPNRFITSISIDPNDVRTIYVTLGGYSRKWFGPDGSLGDDNQNIGTGHLFVSRDAGETFADISGNLPDVTANWATLRGDQLIVGTDVGLFASGTNGAGNASPTFAPLPGVPAADHLDAATAGRPQHADDLDLRAGYLVVHLRPRAAIQGVRACRRR